LRSSSPASTGARAAKSRCKLSAIAQNRGLVRSTPQCSINFSNAAVNVALGAGATSGGFVNIIDSNFYNTTRGIKLSNTAAASFVSAYVTHSTIANMSQNGVEVSTNGHQQPASNAGSARPRQAGEVLHLPQVPCERQRRAQFMAVHLAKQILFPGLQCSVITPPDGEGKLMPQAVLEFIV